MKEYSLKQGLMIRMECLMLKVWRINSLKIDRHVVSRLIGINE